MHRISAMCVETAVAAVLLIPAFWVLDSRRFHNRRRMGLYLLFALYLAAVDAVVGLPSIKYIRFDPNINLQPFLYMFSDYRNSLLNVLLFMPLGFFLPVLWQRFHKVWWTLLFGLGASLVIELMQLFTFRATDVNDLITNTFGTLLGWICARIFLALVPAAQPQQTAGDLLPVCGITLGIIFFLQPFLADLVWAFIL